MKQLCNYVTCFDRTCALFFLPLNRGVFPYEPKSEPFFTQKWDRQEAPLEHRQNHRNQKPSWRTIITKNNDKPSHCERMNMDPNFFHSIWVLFIIIYHWVNLRCFFFCVPLLGAHFLICSSSSSTRRVSGLNWATKKQIPGGLGFILPTYIRVYIKPLKGSLLTNQDFMESRSNVFSVAQLVTARISKLSFSVTGNRRSCMIEMVEMIWNGWFLGYTASPKWMSKRYKLDFAKTQLHRLQKKDNAIPMFFCVSLWLALFLHLPFWSCAIFFSPWCIWPSGNARAA